MEPRHALLAGARRRIPPRSAPGAGTAEWSRQIDVSIKTSGALTDREKAETEYRGLLGMASAPQLIEMTKFVSDTKICASMTTSSRLRRQQRHLRRLDRRLGRQVCRRLCAPITRYSRARRRDHKRMATLLSSEASASSMPAAKEDAEHSVVLLAELAEAPRPTGALSAHAAVPRLHFRA